MPLKGVSHVLLGLCAQSVPQRECSSSKSSLEKGAARRGMVLKSSKLVVWSGLPVRTVERVIARLAYLRVVTRKESGRNFEYKVSMVSARRLERPTFPDRISLGAQLSFDGFGCIPRRVRIGEDELNIPDATLSDLLKLREHFEKKQKNLICAELGG